MIIQSKKINAPLAIGLRWLVATYAEIEYIKDRSDLGYGFIHSMHVRAKHKYKCAALASLEHNKAISLAGILSKKYENLIFVHKVAADYYWLCIIKNHQVWSEVDIGAQTAGDFLGHHEKVAEVLRLARDDFSEEAIDVTSFSYSNNINDEEFPGLTPIKFDDLILDVRNIGKYRIKLIESHRKKIHHLMVLGIIAAAASGVGYYLYDTQNEQAKVRAQQARIALEQQRAFQAKMNYFHEMDNKFGLQQGGTVIQNFLSLSGKLPLQSQGWLVRGMAYDAQRPSQITVKLTRGPYGDLLSFNSAFSELDQGHEIDADNNSGSKTLGFSLPTGPNSLTTLEVAEYQKMLFNPVPLQRYTLISYAQRHGIQLNVGPVQLGQYQVKASPFSISGSDLWNLRKLQYIFEKFPTLVVERVKVDVDEHRKIAWQLEGKIYG